MKKMIRAAVLLTAVCAYLLTASCFGNAWGKKDFAHVTIRNYEAVVSSVRAALVAHSPKITVRFSAREMLMDEISQIAREIMEDACAPTDAAVEGDYIRFQTGGYEMRYSSAISGGKYDYTIKLLPVYYATLPEEQWTDQEIARILRELALPRDAADADKVRAVCDYIGKNVAFDRERRNRKLYHKTATAYAALKYHRVKCQGYAVLAYRLLKEVGVDTRIITGMASYGENEPEYHAWNIVRIGDVYYDLDLTWCGSLETDAFYLKCDEEFGDHQRDEEYDSAAFRERYVMAEQSYEDAGKKGDD